MKTAIFFLAISIIAMLEIGIFSPNEKLAEECENTTQDSYVVCLQEEKYFRENLK